MARRTHFCATATSWLVGWLRYGHPQSGPGGTSRPAIASRFTGPVTHGHVVYTHQSGPRIRPLNRTGRYDANSVTPRCSVPRRRRHGRCRPTRHSADRRWRRQQVADGIGSIGGERLARLQQHSDTLPSTNTRVPSATTPVRPLPASGSWRGWAVGCACPAQHTVRSWSLDSPLKSDPPHPPAAVSGMAVAAIDVDSRRWCWSCHAAGQHIVISQP